MNTVIIEVQTAKPNIHTYVLMIDKRNIFKITKSILVFKKI